MNLIDCLKCFCVSKSRLSTWLVDPQVIFFEKSILLPSHIDYVSLTSWIKFCFSWYELNFEFKFCEHIQNVSLMLHISIMSA
jgi:hypothetical protein